MPGGELAVLQRRQKMLEPEVTLAADAAVEFIEKQHRNLAAQALVPRQLEDLLDVLGPFQTGKVAFEECVFGQLLARLRQGLEHRLHREGLSGSRRAEHRNSDRLFVRLVVLQVLLGKPAYGSQPFYLLA